MSALVWVVGAGGMLGSEVLRSLRLSPALRPWIPPVARLAWERPNEVREQLRAGASTLLRSAQDAGDEWAVVWCAGAGVVGSPSSDLLDEARTWEGLLEGLTVESLPPAPHRSGGRVILVSSAGGVYGQGSGPFSESSECHPVSDYGRAKLRQEQALASWAARTTVSTLVVRVSNLYGPGQKLEKAQGLISHMARCIILGVPVHVYVSLDTIRDYLFTEDAAAAIVGWIERLRVESLQTGGPHYVTKICAAESGTSIAELVGVFRRIARRRLKVVCGLHASTAEQPSRMRFRSEVWAETATARITLVEGVSRVYREMLFSHQAGLLRPLSAHLSPRTIPSPRANPMA